MKKIGLYIIGFFGVALIVLSVIAPSEFHISRELIINRPAAQVYTYAKTLQNTPLWSAWLKLDPKIKISYRGTDGDVDAVASWESEHPEVGTAEQKITKLTENTRIDTVITFKKPFEMSFDSYIITEAQNDKQTKVTMGMHDQISWPLYIVSFIYNISSDNQQKIIKNTDDSLQSLKNILEAGN